MNRQLNIPFYPGTFFVARKNLDYPQWPSTEDLRIAQRFIRDQYSEARKLAIEQGQEWYVWMETPLSSQFGQKFVIITQ